MKKENSKFYENKPACEKKIDSLTVIRKKRILGNLDHQAFHSIKLIPCQNNYHSMPKMNAELLKEWENKNLIKYSKLLGSSNYFSQMQILLHANELLLLLCKHYWHKENQRWNELKIISNVFLKSKNTAFGLPEITEIKNALRNLKFLEEQITVALSFLS